MEGGKIGSFLAKYIGRKILILVVTTILMYFGKITQDIWLYVAITYMASNVLEKMTVPELLKLMKSNKEKSPNE